MASRWLSCLSSILAIWPGSIQAHDIYSHLVDRFGASCCNEMDCQPALYRMTAYGVQMLIAERWIDIPNDVIQYQVLPGDTGRTYGGHWCGSELLDLNARTTVYLTRCAILPPQAASATHILAQ
jgi:hypothetical protein